MNEQEAKAVLTLCCMAAFADGAKVSRERDEIQRIASSLAGGAASPERPQTDALPDRVTLADVARELTTAESKQLAYDMCVCVCDADGARTEAEKHFLASLSTALGLASSSTAPIATQSAALASAPLAATTAQPTASDAEVDALIQSNAILCAALEQIPQSLATMAIIPLQMRLVYKVGKHYGYELDKGHIADFAATAGIGMTAQVIDGFARKLARGLFGFVPGGFMLGGLAARATGSAVAFATTYALGHVAKRYYQGGRNLSGDELRATFRELFDRARGVESQYSQAIARQARGVNVADLLPLVRA
jgi:uncharacterized protein (DUF697 family)/tellurite resistance protein